VTFKGWPDDPRKQGRKVRQVTPSDVDELKTVPKALFITGAGNLCVEPADGYEQPERSAERRRLHRRRRGGPDLRLVPGAQGVRHEHHRNLRRGAVMPTGPFHRWLGGMLLGILLALSAAQPADAGPFGFGFRHKTQTIVAQPALAVAGPKMGANLSDLSYWRNDVIFSDLSHGTFDAGRILSYPTNADATTLDANGWATAPNGGDTALVFQMQPPETATQVVVTWTGTATAVAANLSCTLASSNLGTGTATFNVGVQQPTSGGWQIRITPQAGQTIKITSAKPVGDSSTYAPSFVTQMGAFINGGTLRPLVMLQLSNGSISNYGITTRWNGGTKAAPVRTPTLANRATVGGNWIYNSNGRQSDSIAFESLVDMANTFSGGNLWHPISWNAEDALIDFYADYAAAHLTGNYYPEVANEVWNGGFNVYAQSVREARNAMLPSVGGGSPTFTASISGTVMTVTAGTGLTNGMLIGGNVIDGTTISSLGTGTGGTGTYNVNLSQTVTSQTLMGNPGGAGERYAQRVAEVMSRIKARFVAAGKTNYKRVFAWQNGDTGAAASSLLNYVPAGFLATKNYVDVYARRAVLRQRIARAIPSMSTLRPSPTFRRFSKLPPMTSTPG
jgi:hypothetical protein